jgi:hypothetical protein
MPGSTPQHRPLYPADAFETTAQSQFTLMQQKIPKSGNRGINLAQPISQHSWKKD